MVHTATPAIRRSESVDRVPVGHVAIHLDDRHPAEVPFLFEQQGKRLPRAFGLSAASHVGAFLVFVAIAPLLPASVTDPFLPELTNKDIVWLAVPGPGGGGGGGGNRTPEPPRKAELPGMDKITIPVAKPPEVEAPPKTEPPKEEPPPEPFNIPAKTLAAAEEMATGTLDGGAGRSQGSGGGGGAGTGTGTGIGPGQGSGLGPGWGGGTGGGAYRPGAGVELPRLLREVKPQYTAEAMRAKVQGTVALECVVQTDGTVGEIHVIRSLDPVFGLDQEAVKAARQWRFIPGTRFGQPVPIFVTIELTFTLR